MKLTWCKCRGLTLIELLATLVILSILAATALPYAEINIRRYHELELRRVLREVRTAIDAFHQDWRDGKISKLSGAASPDGYPKTLAVLVQGVELGNINKTKRYYLRRIPQNPFALARADISEHWIYRSYQDSPDNVFWGGQDVYDLRARSDGIAIDGSRYDQW